MFCSTRKKKYLISLFQSKINSLRKFFGEIYIYSQYYIYIYIYNVLVGRVFATGQEDQGSIIG